MARDDWLRVELAADRALLLDVAQMRLHREVPNDGFLPRALRLDAEMRRPENLALQLGDEGFSFFPFLGLSTLA